MRPAYIYQNVLQLLAFLAATFVGVSAIAQTAFVSPVISTRTGASSSFSATVIGPETVGSGCAEMGQNWAHNFNGTADKRLNGFTISGTSYYVNNYGSLTTIMRRNNASGLINSTSSSCAPPTAIPWNDRQIVFFEGTPNLTTNTANIVNSFPSTTLPGMAGYGSVMDMNLVFSRGFINSGADNVFNNNSGTGSTSSPATTYNSNANNIERMDMFVSGGVLVTAANMNRVGIVVVCRGPADDPFVISAIKGMTGGTNIGGGSNYVYDEIIKFNNTWTSKTINGGLATAVGAAQKTTLLAGITSVVLRRMDSLTVLNDQLLSTDYPTISSTVAAQNIVGMFFTFANLGLVAGETFYGYSVSGFDVTAVNSSQFNSYLNSTYFPLRTNPSDGGIDLAGFPGLFAAMDIDDDDDGLPDYLEANLPAAFGDHDLDGMPNWSDTNYPGFIDNNADGVNDNFDPSADSDNDGILNYQDSSFSGFMDSNIDGVNDNFDWDRDSVPNHLDRDCDNDGIPDVVESFGVDENGDGVIDNYTDTDVDGLSQNVDGSNSGSIGSGTGLGALDTDGDGIPNYFDHDSDNDGIPDIIEVYGNDTNNNAIVDGYTDADGDGYSDNIDGDVGNDYFAENSEGALLPTGPDANSDGRCDSWPDKNIDADSKPNPYDLDSDGDGITDVKEAQFMDADNNGQVDGAQNAKGWNTGIAALGSLGLPNTDGTGRTNLYDIDADDDGIPDNVEGLSTPGYMLPLNTDSDADGIDDRYDNFAGFGGNGINPFDKDGDTVPDYLDSDTDNDGQADIIEGNDFNFNGDPDDNVTLTGSDIDDDGLDDRFDNNNSSAEPTSAYMGNGGTTSGDPTPGSITTVQQTAIAVSLGCPGERDWRCMWFVLSCDIISFKAAVQHQHVVLDWKAICRQEIDYFMVERSLDRTRFTDVLRVQGRPNVNETEAYQGVDDISTLNAGMIYYRLRTVGVNGKITVSNIIALRRQGGLEADVLITPNPVRSQLQVQVNAGRTTVADIYILDGTGRMLFTVRENLLQGSNTLSYNQTLNLPAGVYYLRVNLGEMVIDRKFNIVK